MELNLTKLCLNSLAESIVNSPPVIQDKIIHTTTKALKKQVYASAVKSTSDIFSWLLPEIVQKIYSDSGGNPFYHVNRTDIIRMYTHVDVFIIETCVDIAEIVVSGLKLQEISRCRVMDELDEGDY